MLGFLGMFDGQQGVARYWGDGELRENHNANYPAIQAETVAQAIARGAL